MSPAKTKACPACGESIKTDALRCKHCGTDLPVKKCPWCAEVIDADARKCQFCKSYVDKVRCSNCGKHVAAEELSCEECCENLVEEELAERLGKAELKNKIKTWVLTAITVIAVIYGYLQSL
jgi:hypothetical protein